MATYRGVVEWSAGPRFEPFPPESPPPRTYACDNCGHEFEGAPAGAGLLIWTRGDEVRYEEPPLCERCAQEVTTTAMLLFGMLEEQ